MEIIKEILKIIDILTALYFMYYIITGLCVLKDNTKIKKGNKKNKFAILIPARNEEKVIKNLIKSLNAENYPKELYDVYVIINNCRDRTKELAVENGAKIIECERKILSKGAAIRVAISKLNNKAYDAYLIFDADNIVHPEFITKMNDAICSGYDLAQGFRDSKNPSSTWISSSYSIHYLINNIFLNKARMNIDKSSFINGTGFMMTQKFLDRRGFKPHTLTEDIELTVKCALDDEKIAYVEDAITYDEQVESFAKSWRQRKRWSIGTIQCFRYYFTKLLKKAITKCSFSCIDSIVFLASPFIQILCLFSYIVHFAITMFQGTDMNYTLKISGIAFGYLVSVILSIIAIKYSKKKIRNYVKGILTLQIFVLSWLPINIVALFNKKIKWDQIEHTKEITIENILDVKN